MSEWLYSSKGDAVAFVSGNHVFSRSGRFLGELRGQEIWNERYVGEILEGNRLVRKAHRPLTRVEPTVHVDVPLWPESSATPVSPMMLPSDFADVEIEGPLMSGGA